MATAENVERRRADNNGIDDARPRQRGSVFRLQGNPSTLATARQLLRSAEATPRDYLCKKQHTQRQARQDDFPKLPRRGNGKRWCLRLGLYQRGQQI